MPVIPVTWESKGGGWRVQNQSVEFNKTLFQEQKQSLDCNCVVEHLLSMIMGLSFNLRLQKKIKNEKHRKREQTDTDTCTPCVPVRTQDSASKKYHQLM